MEVAGETGLSRFSLLMQRLQLSDVQSLRIAKLLTQAAEDAGAVLPDGCGRNR